MGTRRTDPFSSELSPFSMTDVDQGWASLMRVNPILDWCFKDVWDFLLETQFPVCSLYFKGFTYLGNMKNSVVNPFLDSEERKKDPRNCPGQFETLSRTTYSTSSSIISFRPIFIGRNSKELGGFLAQMNEELANEEIEKKLREVLPVSIEGKFQVERKEVSVENLMILGKKEEFQAEKVKRGAEFVVGVVVDSKEIKEVLL